jgi:hypothetical protein
MTTLRILPPPHATRIRQCTPLSRGHLSRLRKPPVITTLFQAFAVHLRGPKKTASVQKGTASRLGLIALCLSD